MRGRGPSLRLRDRGRLDDRRSALLDAADVLEGQRQLVCIEALRAASELRPLQRPDDGLEALDLAVAVRDRFRHVSHEPLQEGRIGGQIGEVEPHGRVYPDGRGSPRFLRDSRGFPAPTGGFQPAR
jgi:hypothetical protein